MIYKYTNNEIIMNILKNITRTKTIQILKILKYLKFQYKNNNNVVAGFSDINSFCF